MGWKIGSVSRKGELAFRMLTQPFDSLRELRSMPESLIQGGTKVAEAPGRLRINLSKCVLQKMEIGQRAVGTRDGLPMSVAPIAMLAQAQLPERGVEQTAASPLHRHRERLLPPGTTDDSACGGNRSCGGFAKAKLTAQLRPVICYGGQIHSLFTYPD